ncbi:MAG: glutamate-5-semialdehyde dehydrogenase [Oscillospiraceae bacterium]|nr:glutamate-5-semialdehyde dehydrogenase [Oscillospiraceae bacterium]
MTQVQLLGQRAKQAKKTLATASTELKNKALENMAQELAAAVREILQANAEDMKNARANGVVQVMLDRLLLTEDRIVGMAKGITDIVKLPDPIGVTLSEIKRPNGMTVKKITVPLGVIAVIYEARPNVTSDAAALCLKSGNAVILRGGKEAINSSKAIVKALRLGIEKTGLDENCISLVTDTSRDSATELMRLNEYIDVLIPRGGAGLIRSCVENSTVPVIETGTGNCHIYIDKDADIQMAHDIEYKAKTSRQSDCNSAERLVIHKDIIKEALPIIKKRLDEKNVELRGDDTARASADGILPATEDDWGREYLDYIMSVKTVESLDEAIEHISKYSTGHSECIVTENEAAAEEFLKRIDSAAVYHNVSTRFTDGGEFGFGAEIGISTQKLHARGPLGLPQLTSFKYIICGNGQIR